MGRALALLFLVVVLPLAVYAVIATIRYSKLKLLLEGLDNPELWLSKSERREHARKLLRREDDEYTQKLIEKTMSQLKGEVPQ